MIITCENCDSSFRVPKDAIGANGRLVKCTSCDYEWLVKPEPLEVKKEENAKQEQPKEAPKEEVVVKKESTEEQPSSPEPKKGKTKKPPKRFIAPKEPIHKRKWYRYAAYASFAASLLLMIFQILVNSHTLLAHTSSFVNKAYEFAGIYNTEGLVLEKVDCTIHEIRSSKDLGDNIEVEVDAYIKNVSDTPKVMQNIRFVLFDIEREYIGDLIMDIGSTIEPGENYHIEGVLNRVPKNSYYVSIDYGNYIEFVYKNMNILHQ